MEIIRSRRENGLLLVALILFCSWQASDASVTFGFDIHHRYSDAVRGILDFDGLPEKGTVDYYAAMVHRDRFLRGRNLADASNSSNLVFANSNFTRYAPALGFLHYANITVGTPSLWFLVALDTGSDLFWLPCNCTNCVRGLRTTTGTIDFNMYSLSTSSTGSKTPCNSTFCGGQSGQCPPQSSCGYKIQYLSNGTSSSGVLVDDVLHLATYDDGKSNKINAPITFGCGIVQTGSFLRTGAPNGLFGLGVEDISVPSMLASQGLIANSFSMCFGNGSPGRITFGDKGSTNQAETPFNFNQPHRSYNISVTSITVEKELINVGFTAIFDSGTSFTFLNDPAYTALSENFNSQALDSRYQADTSGIPFEYCYTMSSANQSVEFPEINMTMKGGAVYSALDPLAFFSDEAGTFIYCLAVIKSDDINIIGQNFMTGYKVIFNREKKALGWVASDCFDIRGTANTSFVDPRNVPAVPPSQSTVKPEGAPVPVTPSGNDGSSNRSISRNSMVWRFLSILVMFFIHVLH